MFIERKVLSPISLMPFVALKNTRFSYICKTLKESIYPIKLMYLRFRDTSVYYANICMSLSRLRRAIFESLHNKSVKFLEF